MGEIGKIGGLVLLSALKFLFAPSATVYAGYDFFETILITVCGGTLGFFSFFKFGTVITRTFQLIVKPKKKAMFSKKNRLIAKIRRDYGLYGLAVLTPCFLSIPVGSFLASAYYRKDKRTIPIFLGSILLWSLLLTAISVSV